MAALSLSMGTAAMPSLAPPPPSSSSSSSSRATVAMCAGAEGEKSRLKIGSAVVVVDAPATLKTANSISCLLVNGGLVKAGDVGRVVARKPKDVWAIRLAVGTYLIDGKHFKPLSTC